MHYAKAILPKEFFPPKINYIKKTKNNNNNINNNEFIFDNNMVEIYNSNGELIKHPTTGMLSLLHNKCNPLNLCEISSNHLLMDEERNYNNNNELNNNNKEYIKNNSLTLENWNTLWKEIDHVMKPFSTKDYPLELIAIHNDDIFGNFSSLYPESSSSYLSQNDKIEFGELNSYIYNVSLYYLYYLIYILMLNSYIAIICCNCIT
jgi:hypothetical protein